MAGDILKHVEVWECRLENPELPDQEKIDFLRALTAVYLQRELDVEIDETTIIVRGSKLEIEGLARGLRERVWQKYPIIMERIQRYLAEEEAARQSQQPDSAARQTPSSDL